MREWCARQWKTAIGATEYPIEFIWEPARPPHFEYWQWCAADGAYPFAAIRDNQPLQPVRCGSSVVVEEREHLPTRELGRSIAS